jgi:hypothetical protein
MATIERVCKICKKVFMGDRNKCAACRQDEHRAKKARVAGFDAESFRSPPIPLVDDPTKSEEFVFEESEYGDFSGPDDGIPDAIVAPQYKYPDTPADKAWWEKNKQMGPDWPHWLEVVETHECSTKSCGKRFKTRLGMLRSCEVHV